MSGQRHASPAHERTKAETKKRLLCVGVEAIGTPGMGVNLWGASPLYVNPNTVVRRGTQVLAEGKGGTARNRPKEAGAQSYEPTNRNSI